MPDVYLNVGGQQSGPYQPAQIRQLVAEGKVSAGTPAWYEGLNDWATVSVVLAAFPAAGNPPPFVPSTPPVPAAKKGMNGCLLAGIICVGCVLGLSVLSCLAGIALGPIANGIKKAKESVSLQQARQIELAMFAYANDNNGAYPNGKTSTEVFQKLIDGNYITDPAIFYITMPGKSKPTSNHLTAENVCYDVTSGVASDSPGELPIVFATGYVITYSPNAVAEPDPAEQSAFPGMAVAYKNNSAHFFNAQPDGTVFGVIPATFDPGNKTYQQLKP